MRARDAWSRALPLASLLALTAFTDEARACSPPPSGWYSYSLIGEIPENGVVPVSYSCSAQCDPAPDPESFELLDVSGEAVAGSVVLTGARDDYQRYLVFKPEPGELVAGDTYTPSLESVEFHDQVAVGPAVVWKETFALEEGIYGVDRNAGDEICCSGPLDSCGGMPCFFTEFERDALLSIRWGDGSSVEDNQYAFRIIRPELSAVPEWEHGSSGSYELADDDMATCYKLELKRLADDTVIALDEHCVVRPPDVVPGTYPTSESTVLGVLSGCDGPPDDFEEEWCEANATCLTSGPSVFCENYTEFCENSGTGGSSGSGGSGAMGGSSATGGSGAAGGSGATGGSGAIGGSGATGGSGAIGGSGAAGGTGGSDPTGGTGNTTGGTDATGGTGPTGPGGTSGDAGKPGNGDGESVYTEGGCGCEVPSRRAPSGAALLGLMALGWVARRRRSAR